MGTHSHFASYPPGTGKDAIRHDMLAKRAILPPAWVGQVSEEICGHLRQWLGAHLDGPTDIGFYFAIRNEPDLLPLALELAEAGHRLCLPRARLEDKPLSFNLWWPGEDMEEDRHGIPCAKGEVVIPSVALLPMVAFDGNRQRLGYGGGYYDRTLTADPALRAVGVGYGFQQVDCLPVEDHDRPLTAVVTENGLI